MAVPFLACVFTHFTRIHDLSLSCSLFILKQTLKRKKKFTGKNTSPHEGLETFTTCRGLPAVLCTEHTQILALGLPPSLRSKGCWGGERWLRVAGRLCMLPRPPPRPPLPTSGLSSRLACARTSFLPPRGPWAAP